VAAHGDGAPGALSRTCAEEDDAIAAICRRGNQGWLSRDYTVAGICKRCGRPRKIATDCAGNDPEAESRARYVANLKAQGEAMRLSNWEDSRR
jgi:hypothetical protein